MTILAPVALVLARNPDNGLILAVSRPGKPNDLGLPGARVDAGQDMADAAKLGFERETGAKLLDCKWAWMGTAGRSIADGRQVHLFNATAWQGEPRGGRAGVRVVWVNEGRLSEARCSYAGFYLAMFNRLRELKLLPQFDAGIDPVAPAR